MQLGDDPSGKYSLFQGPPRDGYMLVDAINKTTKKKYTGRYLLRRTLFHSPIYDNLKMEYEILGSISHPNIQKLIETTYDFKVLSQIVESEEITLLDYYRYDFPLMERTACEIFYRLIDAVSYLHSNSIVHLDIRPENVFINDNNLKLGGFLASRFAADDEVVSGTYGTPNYQAPEIFTNPNFDGRKADVWACGIFLLALLTGELPYGANLDPDDPNIEQKIAEEVRTKENIIPSYLSTEAQDLLSMMLQREPSKRATITMIKDHKWVSDIRAKLQADPTRELPHPTPPLETYDEFFPPPPSNATMKQLSSDVSVGKHTAIKYIKNFFGNENVTINPNHNLSIDVNGQKQTYYEAFVKEITPKKSCTITMLLISGSEYKFNEQFANLINEICYT